MRKIKKSQGTGSGASDIHVSKWKFFDECSFLDEVIYSNRQVFANLRDEDSSPRPGNEEEEGENYDTAGTEHECNASVKTVRTMYTKKRKRSDDNPLRESARSALNCLPKNQHLHLKMNGIFLVRMWPVPSDFPIRLASWWAEIE